MEYSVERKYDSQKSTNLLQHYKEEVKNKNLYKKHGTKILVGSILGFVSIIVLSGLSLLYVKKHSFSSHITIKNNAVFGTAHDLTPMTQLAYVVFGP